MTETRKPAFIRPLLMRSQQESHRASTQLELLFDLVVVIAIAMAADQLSEQIVDGKALLGIGQFLIAFFLIWWPWNQFSWFASSFDNDDALYRVSVMMMMLGTLLITASLPEFFSSHSMSFTFVGYLILRLSLVFLWIRVARDNPSYKTPALQNAAGLIALQMVWALIIFGVSAGTSLYYGLILLAFIGEIVLPWYLESTYQKSWHLEHIVERFGLLNIIVLGEVLLSASDAFEASYHAGHAIVPLLIAVCAAIIAFAMWWLYFAEEEQLYATSPKRAFAWGNGHFLVFIAGAAVGSGLGVLLELSKDPTELPSLIGLSLSVPVALYVAGIWLVRDRHHLRDQHSWWLLVFSVSLALSGLLAFIPALLAITSLLVLCLVLRLTVFETDRQSAD